MGYAVKLKPCTSPTTRHSWQFVRNRTVHTKTLCTARFTLKGVYKCQCCGVTKYGQPGNPADAQMALPL